MTDKGIESFLNTPGHNTYLHSTKEERARKILEKGFVYAESLQSTTNPYAHIQSFGAHRYFQSAFGDAIIILVLPRHKDAEKHITPISIDEAIALTGLDEDDFDHSAEHHFLPRAFIKGYIRLPSEEIVENAYFMEDSL